MIGVYNRKRRETQPSKEKSHPGHGSDEKGEKREREAVIEITDELAIPENEITYTASRSSGPGGQHVNKVSSRVTLRFDVAASSSLTEAQKQRIMTRLATRLSQDGVLRIVAQQQRSQAANRDAALTRFVALLRAALTPETPRRPTKPAKEAIERRLTEKKRRSRLKQERSSDASWDN